MTSIRRFAWIAAACCVVLGSSGLVPLTARAAATVSDSQITSEVAARLNTYDPDMARLIRVSTHDRVVTLSGHAWTTAAVAKAAQIAWTVDGVVKVENHILLMQ